MPGTASAQPGPANLTVKISWTHAADLDLRVFEPPYVRGTPVNEDGQHCFFSHRKTVNGGSLDGDARGGGPGSDEVCSIRNGPAGNCKVEVRVYAQNGVNFAAPYRIQAWENGRLTMDETHFTQPRGRLRLPHAITSSTSIHNERNRSATFAERFALVAIWWRQAASLSECGLASWQYCQFGLAERPQRFGRSRIA